MAGPFDFASGAITDLFGAAGDKAEANAYSTAAKLAGQNAQITQTSTAISEYQAGRALYQTVGKGEAAAGANGLTGGGSAQDIMRSSVSQGALQKQIIGAQGQINSNAYEAESAQYTGMQQAAVAAQQAGEAGGGLNILGLGASLLGFL